MVGASSFLPLLSSNANGTRFGRNGMEMKSDFRSSSGLGRLPSAPQLLKPDASYLEPSLRTGGKNVDLGAEHRKSNPGPALGEHEPLVESRSGMNGGRKTAPPLSEDQIADMARYHYLSWLSHRHPEDEMAKAALMVYDAGSWKPAKPCGQGDGFLLEANERAIAASSELIRLHQQFDENAGALEDKKRSRLEELEREKNSCEKWVEELYENKKELLAGRLSKRLVPLDDFIRKLKKFWKTAQVALPAAGALMVGSHFLSGIRDAISNLPVVSQLTPEIAGAGLVGIWLFAKLGNALWDSHLKAVKAKLPEKAELRKRAEMERITGELGRTAGRHIEEMKKLQEGFDEGKEAVLEGLRAQYRGLLSKFGYARPQVPSELEPLLSSIALN